MLDFNRLTSVPVALFQLAALKKLSLQNNFIVALDPQCVLSASAKLSSVEFEGNPLAYPPHGVWSKGWSTVKKWVPANPSHVTYRM